jgi:AraC family transcriptional regulator of adaptative response/methylated-DNA-[protein]-cysteine methyltransferase
MLTTLHASPAQKYTSETITFGFETCTFGLVLVATTAQGIGAILLGSEKRSLVGQLRSIFPRAKLHDECNETGVIIASVIRFIETSISTVSLRLDIRGTAFQKQVWQTLSEIPAGRTVTYKALALKLGSTAQEIGEACAANTLAIVIPCHRVIRSDGGLAGFRWGIQRKRLLLQREQEMFPDPDSLFATPALVKGKAPF